MKQNLRRCEIRALRSLLFQWLRSTHLERNSTHAFRKTNVHKTNDMRVGRKHSRNKKFQENYELIGGGWLLQVLKTVEKGSVYRTGTSPGCQQKNQKNQTLLGVMSAARKLIKKYHWKNTNPFTYSWYFSDTSFRHDQSQPYVHVFSAITKSGKPPRLKMKSNRKSNYRDS